MLIRHLFATLIAAIVPLAFSSTADAEDRRHYLRGEFLPGGNFMPTVDPAATRLQSANLWVEIAFSMEAWNLIGTPVQACNITWHHRDRQGNRLTDEIYLDLPQRGASLGLNAEALNVLSADPAIRPNVNGRHITGLIIRRDVLSSEPRVFNLDFWAQAPERQNTETGNTIEPFYMRCLTGALGGAGEEGFNTPYAFDMDEVFRDIDDGTDAAELFRYITQIDGATDPSDFENAVRVELTEIDFNLISVRNYLHGRLLEEARQARSYANAMEQRLREQQAEEAERQAAERTPVPAQTGAISAADRRFSPVPDSVGTLSDIMGRVQTVVEAEVAERLPETRPSQMPEPNTVARVVIPDMPVSSADVEDAIKRANALETSERALAEIIANASEPQPRDMTDYEEQVPDDPLANFATSLKMSAPVIERLGRCSSVLWRVNTTVSVDRGTGANSCTFSVPSYTPTGEFTLAQLEEGVSLRGGRVLNANCDGVSSNFDFYELGLYRISPDRCRALMASGELKYRQEGCGDAWSGSPIFSECRDVLRHAEQNGR